MRLLLPVTCCLLALMIVTPPAARAAEAKDPQPTVDTSPSTATLSVLLVGDGNQFLEQALKALGLKQLAQVKPEEYEKAATDKAGAAGGRPFDVIVFDRCRPKRAARARGVLMFGELPPDAALPTIPDEQHPDQPARLDAARADRWDDRHPALMHVQMRRLWVRDGIRLDATRVPAEWNVVVGCQQGPLIL